MKLVEMEKDMKLKRSVSFLSESGLRHTFRNRRISVQTPLGAQPYLWIQPHDEAPVDLGVEQVSTAVISIGLVRLLPGNGPKLSVEQ